MLVPACLLFEWHKLKLLRRCIDILLRSVKPAEFGVDREHLGPRLWLDFRQLPHIIVIPSCRHRSASGLSPCSDSWTRSSSTARSSARFMSACARYCCESHSQRAGEFCVRLAEQFPFERQDLSPAGIASAVLPSAWSRWACFHSRSRSANCSVDSNVRSGRGGVDACWAWQATAAAERTRITVTVRGIGMTDSLPQRDKNAPPPMAHCRGRRPSVETAERGGASTGSG